MRLLRNAGVAAIGLTLTAGLGLFGCGAQQQSAQQDLAQLEQKLYAPIFEKARNAVSKIAKDKGLTFVFELSTNPVVYYNEAQSVDLLPLAKAALGIPAEKVAPTQIQ